jgi:hypothetical protein
MCDWDQDRDQTDETIHQSTEKKGYEAGSLVFNLNLAIVDKKRVQENDNGFRFMGNIVYLLRVLN